MAFDKRITEGVRLLEDNNIRFAVVKLISCNGAESASFTDANCGFEVLKDENKVPCFLPFTVIFEKGLTFLKTVSNTEDREKLQGPTNEALSCLEKFYKTKGKY
jgi:hypothetical protein